ncbi:MAG: hypothetical protein UW68_C0065G0004 [Candidatus Collierbacteria bacterium GW2011_GWB1_44_6]|uniref:Uncharacterized protein n=1 Tax=Candidatus Collierbacteria bacterium GW2011_GWB1_44_6 TaxID=1618384 RepID=A0A0G1JJA8_9BACT|nr:MAG: hypothetical protein UW68_C0065G0004 [Candidatus Collierbacteria bacterium GW2011_GWB1_44_6]
MNIFSAKLRGTEPKAHIRVETVIPHGKVGAKPLTYMIIVNPDGKELIVDEGVPTRKVAEAIVSRKPVIIPHVGYKIAVETKGKEVMIGWSAYSEKDIVFFAYPAEILLEQIGPELINQYLGLIIVQ